MQSRYLLPFALLALSFPFHQPLEANSRPSVRSTPLNSVDKRPNIVLVMADDQGWGDMAYNGHPSVQTPHFDAAAKTGVNFSRFYAAAPVCSPTRASIMTGRHPNRIGVFKWGYPLRPQEDTIAEILGRNGYSTAHFGKWHLGSMRPDSLVSPGKSGFQHWISSPNFFDIDPILCNNGIATQYSGESSIVTADLAIEWISTQSKTKDPFFAVVWFGSPHSPHRAITGDRSQYAGLFPDEKNKNLRKNKINFLGEVSGMDRAYGKIQNCLKDLNLEDNTILWYTSDNGALPKVGSAGKFRGHKGQIYEGGLLVPAFLHWPKTFANPITIDARCNTCDILPTLLDWAGIAPNESRLLDGTSLASLLDQPTQHRNKPMGFWDYTTNGRSVPAHKLMKQMLAAQSANTILKAPTDDAQADQLPTMKLDTTRFPGHAAWIHDDWKLHRIENKNSTRYELYHLGNDPYESQNILDQHPQLVKKLQAELAEWLASVAGSYNGNDYPQPSTPNKQTPGKVR